MHAHTHFLSEREVSSSVNIIFGFLLQLQWKAVLKATKSRGNVPARMGSAGVGAAGQAFPRVRWHVNDLRAVIIKRGRDFTAAEPCEDMSQCSWQL